MYVASLMGKSECDDYSVVLANIQFQVTFGKVCSMVYMLQYVIGQAKEQSLLEHTTTWVINQRLQDNYEVTFP